MGFSPETLTGKIDWEKVPDNEVRTINGKNQMVRWRRSNVTVLENGQKPVALETFLEGQGRVEVGTVLYISNGKVVEEEKEEGG